MIPEIKKIWETALHLGFRFNESDAHEMWIAIRDSIPVMTTHLQKFNVCSDCHSLGITYTDCSCSNGNYSTIELEFEVCNCCNNVIEDGSPADTKFNEKQIKRSYDRMATKK